MPLLGDKVAHNWQNADNLLGLSKVCFINRDVNNEETIRNCMFQNGTSHMDSITKTSRGGSVS